MDKNDFELRMEKVRDAMKELIDDHKMYFGHDDEISLLEIKKAFVEQLIFWIEAEVEEEERQIRIEWEYWNLFDKVVDIINNNVEAFTEEEDEPTFPF